MLTTNLVPEREPDQTDLLFYFVRHNDIEGTAGGLLDPTKTTLDHKASMVVMRGGRNVEPEEGGPATAGSGKTACWAWAALTPDSTLTVVG